ncbi:MAG: hypothetical protein C5B49_09990 [Bdellovibrio sp.]|nr:MAG: hypothetical protein C5B49_09990 [Bdellovibrio sp.]
MSLLQIAVTFAHLLIVLSCAIANAQSEGVSFAILSCQNIHGGVAARVAPVDQIAAAQEEEPFGTSSDAEETGQTKRQLPDEFAHRKQTWIEAGIKQMVEDVKPYVRTKGGEIALTEILTRTRNAEEIKILKELLQTIAQRPEQFEQVRRLLVEVQNQNKELNQIFAELRKQQITLKTELLSALYTDGLFAIFYVLSGFDVGLPGKLATAIQMASLSAGLRAGTINTIAKVNPLREKLMPFRDRAYLVDAAENSLMGIDNPMAQELVARLALIKRTREPLHAHIFKRIALWPRRLLLGRVPDEHIAELRRLGRVHDRLMGLRDSWSAMFRKWPIYNILANFSIFHVPNFYLGKLAKDVEELEAVLKSIYAPVGVLDALLGMVDFQAANEKSMTFIEDPSDTGGSNGGNAFLDLREVRYSSPLEDPKSVANDIQINTPAPSGAVPTRIVVIRENMGRQGNPVLDAVVKNLIFYQTGMMSFVGPGSRASPMELIVHMSRLNTLDEIAARWVEIQEAVRKAQEKGRKVLVIIDNMYEGSDFDSAALTMEIVMWLLEQGAFAIVTATSPIAFLDLEGRPGIQLMEMSDGRLAELVPSKAFFDPNQSDPVWHKFAEAGFDRSLLEKARKKAGAYLREVRPNGAVFEDPVRPEPLPDSMPPGREVEPEVTEIAPPTPQKKSGSGFFKPLINWLMEKAKGKKKTDPSLAQSAEAQSAGGQPSEAEPSKPANPTDIQ